MFTLLIVNSSGGDIYSNPNNFAQFPSSSQNNIKAALWNARSTRNKTLSVYDFVLENNIDILFVTETWLCEDDPVIIGELTPPSYSFLNIPRTQTDLYGGIGILYRSSLKLSIKQTDMKTITFEHAIVTDVLRCVQYIVVYRPPLSAVNGFKTKDYLTEIDEFLSDVNMSANKIVALGDFNLHVDVPTKSDVATFMSILSSLNMSQHVVDPSHKRGHTLDLIITRSLMMI